MSISKQSSNIIEGKVFETLNLVDSSERTIKVKHDTQEKAHKAEVSLNFCNSLCLCFHIYAYIHTH